MTYSEIVRELVQERTARELDDRSAWNRSAVARQLGVSNAVLRYWEVERNRATLEQLDEWARLFGRRVVVVTTDDGDSPHLLELQHALVGLSAEDQAQVIRYARALRELAGTRDHSTLVSVVEAAVNSMSNARAPGKRA